MDTVTGQCDHIVGFFMSEFSQYGESDRLIRESESVRVDQAFTYCPICGLELGLDGSNATNASCAATIEL